MVRVPSEVSAQQNTAAVESSRAPRNETHTSSTLQGIDRMPEVHAIAIH